jgi:uncharacterized protein YbjT (DUF2867 family)
MTPSSTSQDDRTWAARLQRWGLDDVAPVLIEVLRPFSVIGGQILTLTSPLLTTFMDEGRLARIIETLDDPERLDRLARSLDREADQ